MSAFTNIRNIFHLTVVGSRSKEYTHEPSNKSSSINEIPVFVISDVYFPHV